MTDRILDERKQKKLASMSRRDEERKNDLQTKQDERKTSTATGAGRKYFEDEFPQLKSEVENLFEKLTLNSTDQQIRQDFIENLQKLEKFVTEHSEILRSRDVANAQNDVTKLRQQFNSLQSSQTPLDFKPIESTGTKIDIVTSTTMSNATATATSSNTVTINNRDNELIRLTPDELDGKDVAIENLRQCELFLLGVPSSLQMSNLQRCIVIVGPCSRSIMIDQCEQCEFALAAQQLRIHRSQICDFYVHITAQPIIEDCHECRFAPYNVEYRLKTTHIEQSGLTWKKDFWDDVRDFNHLIPGIPSPNWRIIEEEERKEWSLDKD